MTADEREFVERRATTRLDVRSPARTVTALASWLALTVLFTGGGFVLLATAVTAAGPLTGATATVVLVVGVLGTLALTPTLARVVTRAAVERIDDALDRRADSSDRSPDDSRLVGCVRDERGRCRPPCPCGA